MVAPAGIPQTNSPIPKTKMLERIKDIRFAMLDFEGAAWVEKFRTVNRLPLFPLLIYYGVHRVFGKKTVLISCKSLPGASSSLSSSQSKSPCAVGGFARNIDQSNARARGAFKFLTKRLIERIRDRAERRCHLPAALHHALCRRLRCTREIGIRRGSAFVPLFGE